MLLKEFLKVEKLAGGSKLTRLFNHPLKYLLAQVHRHLLYRISLKPLAVKTKTFWNEDFHLLLPAAMDIFLTGGKSDASEIRLTKYLLHHVTDKKIVFDIGTHFGFYSLLASKLSPEGSIYSFEASRENYTILLKNVANKKNIIAENIAIADKPGSIQFYEYPVLQSEYNTIDNSQFSGQGWNKSPQVTSDIPATTIDTICAAQNIIPDFIKIDAEGAEYLVIKGGARTLAENDVVLSIEYLHAKRNNRNHQLAASLLYDLNYKSFSIRDNGELQHLADIDAYLQINHLESDNIIFKKSA